MVEQKIKINVKNKDVQIEDIANIGCTEILKEIKKTISTMESCTSGLIASLLTDTEGASNAIKGAFVTYCNEAKIMQGVSADIIDMYGVYSYETAHAMAYKCRQTYNADFGIGITGTTGNVDENNSDSMPGEIYYCIIDDQENATNVKLILDTKDKSRYEIKLIIAYYLFNTLLDILLAKKELHSHC